MRRLSILLSFALVAGVLAIGGSAAADSHAADLIAAGGGGSGIDVGDVLVSNDTSNLYVEYLITDTDWCLTETHLAVADSLDGLPQTKKGNPVPGQFPYSATHDCVTTYTYTIPMSFAAGDDLFVAAHAVVKSAVDDCSQEVWQIGDVETMAQYPDGPYAGMTLYTNYADEFNWTGATPFTAGPSLAVLQPPFDDPFVIGVSDTSDFPYNANYNRGYGTDFDVQWDGSLHFGGELIVSWSPGQSAAETKVVSDGGGTLGTFNRTGTPSPGMGYFLNTYPVYEEAPVALPPAGTGTHTLNFTHTRGDGTFWDWVRLVKPCERDETAWGSGYDFPGANWATYFQFEVQPVLLETIQVPSDGSTVSSSTVLETGIDYRLDASGIYTYWPAQLPDAGIADAHCSLRPAGSFNPGPGAQWINGDSLVPGYMNYLEVWVDGVAAGWSPTTCDTVTHSYSLQVTGSGTSAAFQIVDNYYADNSGFITVELYWLG